MAIEPLAQRLVAYREILIELKRRHVTLNDLFGKPGHGMPAWFVTETCYLQLRFQCELIALGCLVVHGDIPATQTQRLQKAYKADMILKALEDLHPDFYPTPINMTMRPREPSDPKAEFELGLRADDFLSKDLLPTLYHECGERLHANSLRMRASKKTENESVKTASDWLRKVKNLLDVHTILAADESKLHFVMMAPLDGGEVKIHPVDRIKSDDGRHRFEGEFQDEKIRWVHQTE